MHLLQAVGAALEMIRAHKLRSFFTILGTLVGVTFLIAVVTLITGVDRYVREEFASQIIGVNSVMVRRTPTVSFNEDSETRRGWQRRPRLTFDEAAWLAERMQTPGTVALFSEGSGRVEGTGGKMAEGVTFTAASASYFTVRSLSVAQGRVFHQQEDERGAQVAVIGMDVAEALFDGRSPLGETVRIRGWPYQVIGVLEKQGSLFGMSMDNRIIAPARSRLNGIVNPRNQIDEITFQVADPALMPAAVTELEGWMRLLRQLRPGEPNNFALETVEESLSFWTRISQILYLALPAFVGISLVVGAVVIMNIMLVSVTERTREIGLRKSLGARRKDILSQFIVEAGTLSGIGGLLGIGLGIAMASVVARFSPLPAAVAPWSIVLGLTLGVGVGIAAGAYPAYRAAKLDPIEALRHE